MKYQIDHDLHIHSQISLCSKDPEQTTARILQYAKDSGLRQICLTDHFWDERVEGASKWYKWQDFPHICEALPLPRSNKTEFLFGAETDLNMDMALGVSRERFDEFGFVIIPTTHLHMSNNISPEDGATAEGRAKVWISRLDGLLDMDLPFHKVGIAHLTGFLFPKAEEDQLEMMALIPEEEMRRCFRKAAQLGVGIELNLSTFHFPKEQAELRLRPFKIAKECGCKFYFGSDAHVPTEFINGEASAEWVVDYLGLEESDKFII